jgi:hypothetical protein
LQITFQRMEIIVLLVTLALCGATWGLFRLCDRLRGQ